MMRRCTFTVTDDLAEQSGLSHPMGHVLMVNFRISMLRPPLLLTDGVQKTSCKLRSSMCGGVRDR